MRVRLALLCGGVAIVLGGVVAASFQLLSFHKTAANEAQSAIQANHTHENESQPEVDVVPVKVGDNYYSIPANVLASRPEGSREEKFLADESVLLHFHWPTMSGRTRASSEADRGSRVQVLMYSVRTGSDPYPALISRFAGQALARVTSHAVICTDPLLPQSCPDLYTPDNDKLRRLPDSDEALHFERYDFPNRDPNFMSDILIEKSGGTVSAFSICTRPSSKGPGSICSLHFTDRSNWFEAIFDYRRIPLSDVRALRSAILTQIEQFERAGYRIKNSTIESLE